MAAWAAGIAAGGALIGDWFSSLGQGNTNQTNMSIAEMNNQFNAQQAQLNRSFQANEAATAMQTRVTDLKAAGLNPALAYQLGGAAVPGGATASAAPNPQISNPNAAFGNLGQQTSNALALNSQQAQIDLLKAQANKANTESGTEIPAEVANIQSQTGLNDVRSAEVYKNVQMLSLALNPSDSSDKSLYSENLRATTALNTARAAVAQMDVQTQSDTMASLIKARNDENYANSIGASNVYHASDGAFGRIMAFFQVGKPVVSTAVGAAGAASDVAGFIP